jgi:hypothetical protein
MSTLLSLDVLLEATFTYQNPNDDHTQQKPFWTSEWQLLTKQMMVPKDDKG